MSAPSVGKAFVWACAAVGTLARVLPLFDPGGRALTQFPSEDGYLMLTISRNLALGHGLSIEAGNTLTNGTQPLMTFVYGGLFWLVDGDRASGVWLVQLLGIAIAIGAALLLRRVALEAFSEFRHGRLLAAIVAAAWYASPFSTRFTQNCLETGAATLMPMAVGLLLLRRRLTFDEPWPIRSCLLLGIMLGVAFWVRNDAVLLSVAICSALVVSGALRRTTPLARRVAEAGAIGTSALLVVLPWLAYNYSLFGNIVPVSGISQGADSFAENLGRVPAILAEQISVVGLIPVAWETDPRVVAATSAVVLIWIGLVYREAAHARPARRQFLVLLGLWATLHASFYGVIYGAGYFMGRYLFPLSTWVCLLTVWLGYRVWIRAGRPNATASALVPFTLALALIVGLDVRAHRHGLDNGHFQVVDWVEKNVSDDLWVAAIQTGTLGFFHDRTFNLDGKVSPPALRAKLEGRTREYVISKPVEYLVDWLGIATWLEDPNFAKHFELVLLDEEDNLAVLSRRGS